MRPWDKEGVNFVSKDSLLRRPFCHPVLTPPPPPSLSLPPPPSITHTPVSTTTIRQKTKTHYTAKPTPKRPRTREADKGVDCCCCCCCCCCCHIHWWHPRSSFRPFSFWPSYRSVGARVCDLLAVTQVSTYVVVVVEVLLSVLRCQLTY